MRFSPAETPARSHGLLDAELGAHPRFSPDPVRSFVAANVGLLERELDSVRIRPAARPAAARRKLEPALTAQGRAPGR